MRRVYALLIGVSLVLLASPAAATADPYASPAERRQAIDLVIKRALSQRGVPFSWGGGDASGPTRGRPQTPPPDTDPAAGPAASPLVLPPDVPVSGPLTDVPRGTVVQQGADIAGDQSVDTVGFDASGLIQYAFAGVGIKMPRSSGEQYKVGRKVLPSQALPGDLLFYGPDGTQSVAMFVGNGKMVEATQPVVTVSPVRTKGMTPYLVRVIEW